MAITTTEMTGGRPADPHHHRHGQHHRDHHHRDHHHRNHRSGEEPPPRRISEMDRHAHAAAPGAAGIGVGSVGNKRKGPHHDHDHDHRWQQPPSRQRRRHPVPPAPPPSPFGPSSLSPWSPPDHPSGSPATPPSRRRHEPSRRGRRVVAAGDPVDEVEVDGRRGGGATGERFRSLEERVESLTDGIESWSLTDLRTWRERTLRGDDEDDEGGGRGGPAPPLAGGGRHRLVGSDSDRMEEGTLARTRKRYVRVRQKEMRRLMLKDPRTAPVDGP